MEPAKSEAAREDRLFETTAEARTEGVHLPTAEIQVNHSPRRTADVAAIRRLSLSIARLRLLPRQDPETSSPGHAGPCCNLGTTRSWASRSRQV